MKNLNPTMAQAIAPWAPSGSLDAALTTASTRTATAMAKEHYGQVLRYALTSVWDRCDLGQGLEAALERASEVYGVDREDLATAFESTPRKVRPA